MLYGYREIMDNRITTIVAAADTVDEYDNWVGLLTMQSPHQHCVEFGASLLTDHLFRDNLKGYKRSVIIVYHDSELQRDNFINLWHITTVRHQAARDRQKDMIWLKQRDDKLLADQAEETAAKAEGREVTGNTIEELHGLVDNDPWDRRTPEQREEDETIKKQMKDLQKQGNISGDSFGSAKEQREARAQSRGKAIKTDQGNVHITDIHTTENDGKISIDSILARKFGGEVDNVTAETNRSKNDAIAKEQKAGRRSFSPEDFAAVLAGDGSADHLNIPAHPDANKQRREPGNRDLQLSETAEAARHEYQAQQRAIAKAASDKQRVESDIEAKTEYEAGIFRGCDLFPDQTIERSKLPNSIQEALTRAKISDNSFPLKDYPYNSQLGKHILLPCDGMVSSKPMRLSKTDNLEIVGNISMDEPSVTIAMKQDATIPGWAVYSRLRDAKDDESNVTYDIYVICIR